MNNYLDIIMLVVMVPTLLIMFFYEYPVKWKDRKFIFGVRNRSEFKEEKAASEIDKITASTRKQALIIMISSFVIMGLIMLLPDLTVRMAFWIVFVFAALGLNMVPFMKANREMKSLKREIGIKSAPGTVFTDLKGAGAVRALKVRDVVIPNALSAAFFIATIIFELVVMNNPGMAGTAYDFGSFMMSSMTGAFLLVGIILIPVAVMMDRIRNEVISEDSDTNMNYNRAKKKVFADWFVLMSWINTVFILVAVPVVFLLYSNIVMILLMTVYLLMIMASLIGIAGKSLAVDKRYRKETTIDVDDDDRWLLGSIYYNPDDKRFNVAKRMGIGGTINVAHPAGKAIMIICGLLIIGVVVMSIFFAIMGKSSMSVKIENDTLICSQLTDWYKIPVADIEDLEICNDASTVTLMKQAGVNMPPMYYGTYSVNGERDCKVFMNLESDTYITFKAGGTTYYISGNTEAETMEVFEMLKSG